jgi:microcystin-dependent protein
MSKCSNCSSSFNGCDQIVPDKCVRYTGVDVPALGIVNGDTLGCVESKIVEFLLNVSKGDGVIPVIDQNQYCTLVSSYLPTQGTINLNNILSALIQSVCFTKTKLDELKAEVVAVNADYSIKCLTGVTQSSNTHEILQATIDNLCLLNTAVNAVILDLSTNYVKLNELNDLIENYLNGDDSSSLNSNKMVPYVAYEYYGPLANFDAGGAGFGVWDKVYLCNGNNGTPDKRGRVAVGTTDGSMRGDTMSSVINPSTAGNPSHTLGGMVGANTISLTDSQIPSHTHNATSSVVDPGHQHDYQTRVTDSRAQFSNDEREVTMYQLSTRQTATATTNITVSTVISNTGGGLGHPNVQPTIGAYYIMYIP